MRKKIIEYYEKYYDEQRRLLRESREIEFVRTKELISRYLPSSSIKILDIGGGAGIYSAWLAKLGHQVHLIDLVPLHIEQAKEALKKQPKYKFTTEVGDATNLKQKDNSYDAILMLGPLYHLADKKERIEALRESKRVLKKDGVLFAAAINRFAGLLEGMKRGWLDDEEFKQLVENDLKTGKHLPSNHKYFTTSYLHHPDELATEIKEADFSLNGIFGIEGPGCLLPDSEITRLWKDKDLKEQLLYTARKVEQEPTLLGVSMHLLAIAYNK